MILSALLLVLLAVAWNHFVKNKPQLLVVLYIVILPFQDFAVMLLTNVSLFSPTSLRVLLVWKEVFLILTIAYLLVSRKDRFGLINVDYFILFFLSWVAFYSVLPNAFFPRDNSLVARMAGLRFDLSPVLLYLLGRYLVVSESFKQHVLRRIVLITAIVLGFGIFETLLIPRESYTELLDALGRPNFIALKSSETNQSRILLIEESQRAIYVRVIGGVQAPRLISFYMMPLLPAYYGMIVGTVLMVARLAGEKSDPSLRKNGALLLISGGILLTQTRAVILAMLVMIALGAYYSNRKQAIKLFFLLLVPVLFFIQVAFDFLVETWNLQDSSSVGHLTAMLLGVAVVIQHPFGVGLGQGGAVGKAFGDLLAGYESLYITIAGEIGVVGLGLFLLFCFGLLRFLSLGISKEFRSGGDWVIVNSAFLLTFGFMFTSLTTETWFGFRNAWFYWILTGFAVTIVNNRRLERPAQVL